MKAKKCLEAKFSDEIGASRCMPIVCQYCGEQFEGTGFQIGSYGMAQQGKCPNCRAYQSQVYYFIPDKRDENGELIVSPAPAKP